MGEAQVDGDAFPAGHAEVAAEHQQEAHQPGGHVPVGEGFDHGFGLEDAGGEALQHQQPHGGVLFDRPFDRGRRGRDHLHSGEGHSVIKAV